MAKKRTTEMAAPDAAQETQGTQDATVHGTAQEAQETAQEAQETAQEAQETQEMAPDSGQDAEEEQDLPPGAPLEYAVAGCKSLNLRERPGLDEPVIARLPRGVGVVPLGEAVSQADGHWLRVRTGTLDGWVMDQYLEPVWS